MYRYKENSLGIFLSIILFLVTAEQSDAQLTLVEDHVPRAVIVTGSNPTLTEHHAARELRHYLRLVTGVALPIVTDEEDLEGEWVFKLGTVMKNENSTGPGVTDKGVKILLGKNRYVEEWGITVESPSQFPDPVRIETRDRSLIILGYGDRGTLFGVYQLLEEFIGCRWVMPGPLGEIIPHKGTITIPETAKTYVPSFDRRTSSPQAWMNMYDTDWYVDWSLKNRFQVIDEQIDYLPDRGGVDILDLDHAWGGLINHERYRIDHPEYLALNQGRRFPRPPAAGMFCSGNPEVVKRVRHEVVQFFKQRPDADVMSLAPSDGGNFCECDHCMALDTGDDYTWRGRTRVSMSDRILTLVNDVAQAFPKRKFLTYAYYIYVKPPVRVKPLPNVMVILWHYNPANYAARLNDPADPENAEFNDILTGWLSMGTNIVFGAYSSKTMWHQLPFPIARRLGQDLQYLHSIGVRNFTCMPHITGRWAQLGPAIYVQAKLLWDVTLDPEEVLRDYYRHSYGSAAPAMTKYFTLLEDAAQAPGVYFNNNPFREARNFLTPLVMMQAGRYLTEAEAAVHSGRVRERVELVRIAYEYARRYLEIRDYIERFDRTGDEEMLATAEILFQEMAEYVKRNSHKGAVIYSGGGQDILNWQGGSRLGLRDRRQDISK